MLEKFYITCEQENHWTLTDKTRADDKIIFLDNEYEKFWQKILRGENFALSRCADGELGLMLGREMHGCDGGNSSAGITVLGEALKKSLKIDAPNFYYGISCPCCDSAAYYWYLREVKSSNITFSNIWLNENFKAFQNDFQTLERDAVLITNWRGKDRKFGRLKVKRHYLVSDDCVKFWEEDGENLIRQIISETGHEKNLLYVVSAGPLSCVIIAELFKNNSDNCYIDFGSATDLMTHERITRPYMIDGTPYSKQGCWMFDRKKIDIDIDVVLTCYKRPQVLAQQLDAIKNQTLKPHRIFLYQDGIEGYYKVELNDKILSEFDACKISAKNCGVWKRFEFAKEIAKSPYVCVFDDDTIPGARWLENCHINMMQNRGVYGTNGVLVANPENYPREKLSVGWHNPNLRTCAVDLVGHAWFLEREYLEWMLAKPYSKKHKLAGEDMALSFAALERGFGTYVPQHPKKILSLWGSLPEFGWKYGTDEAAISMSNNNLRIMRSTLKEMHSDGWRFLLEKNPAYLKEILYVLSAKNLSPEMESLKMIKCALDDILPTLGRKPPIFLGERKYSSLIQRIFDLQAEDYHVLENENDEIETEKLFDTLRLGAIHIFFTDVYGDLEPFLTQWGLKEKIDFTDGRRLLTAYSFNFD
ncbi:MAG: glycosyltransferase family 2 protein [Selenomonadaceae bacterium]|nr:glycosyltransferase family 2 protein [Selenomonadaceae bacterium]